MNDRRLAWDMYFASVCALQFHPRNTIKSEREKIQDSVRITNQMLEERDKRWPQSSAQ